MGPGEYLEIYDSHAHYDDKAFDSDRAWLLEKQLPLSGEIGRASCRERV